MSKLYGKDSNFKGNKDSGRKTDAEIVKKYIDTNLANEIGNQELKRIKATPIKKRKREDLKEIVMPIVIKNIGEKVEHSGFVASSEMSEEEKKKLDNILNKNATK